MNSSRMSHAVSPTKPTPSPRSINIAILAMGGEGGGVLANWILDMAEHSGYLAQTTSVPGVAQRTGSTIYYVELFPEAAAAKAGKSPVMALMPVPGEVDVVIASELMEAGRAITRGLVTPDRTTLIASTNRVFSMTEKTAMGDGRVDAEALLQAGREAAKTFVAYDFARMAEDTGSVISATLFGALAGSATLPFDRQQFEDAIIRSGVSVESSLRAFAAGSHAAAAPAVTAIPPAGPAIPKTGPALQQLAARVSAHFPAVSHAIVLAGMQRLADYLDLDYAAEYLDRLDPVKSLDQQHGKDDCILLGETARYLALWMSYEDAIRVADLKTRRTRFERVEQESHVDGKQLLEINEFLHPRLEEFADILPARLGSWLVRTGWAGALINRLTKNGKVLKTTSLGGFLQLYLVASLRRWRRGTLRFKREQQRINNWLVHVKQLAPLDYELALEVAECPQLIKGYGDTYVLGSRNFDALMQVLPALCKTKGAAARLRGLREAALADDTGKQLASALKEFSTRQEAYV